MNMKVWTVEGEHPNVPGTPHYVCATEEQAQLRALELINVMRSDFDAWAADDQIEPLGAATDPAKWQEALRDTQLAMLRRDDSEFVDELAAGDCPWGYSSTEDALDELTECWVDITEDTVELPEGWLFKLGDAPAGEAVVMAEPLPLSTMQLYRALAEQARGVIGDTAYPPFSKGECMRATLDALEAADPSGEPGTTTPIAPALSPKTVQLYRTLADRVLTMTDSGNVPDEVSRLLLLIEDEDPSNAPGWSCLAAQEEQG